jgi:hypothetical protein
MPSLSDISSAISGATAASPNSAPWLSITPKPSNSQAAFYVPIAIDETRWDQLFPYRFIVVDTNKGNQVVDGGKVPNVTVSVGTSGQSVEFVPVNRWVYNLPITPEQLSIVDQYAITTTATLKGIGEEHNGVPFKNITASGSFGVWTQRTANFKPSSPPSIVQSIFGGTIAAVGNVVAQAQSVINSATSSNKNPKPVTTRPGDVGTDPTSTGYYQAQTLQQFLEQYAIAKTDPANASWRLVFDIPKQSTSYVVTPIQFNWRQDKGRSMEIQYNLSLKAWRRIDLNSSAVTNVSSPFAVTPGLLQQILNTIAAARSTAASAIALIGAVRSDVDNVFNVLTQTSLLVKDLAGVVLTAADLPKQLISDAQSTIKDALANVGLSPGAGGQTDPTVANAIKAITTVKALNEGLSQTAVTGGQNGAQAASNTQTDPINNLFSNPNANFDLFNVIPINKLNLSKAQQNVVNNAVESARALTVADVKAFRATIQQLAIQLSNSFGTGDAYYNQVYGLPAPATSYSPITLDQFDILTTFYDMLAAYDALTATTYLDDINQQSNMDYVAGLAAESGIEFNNTQAKILAPVPFGLTVEAIAARYLGDPQRWLEIVTLNNLRDPYIDENGFQLPLLSNASGRQVTISDVSNLYIGQRVIVMSATQTATARTILNIDELSTTSYLLTLDGDANLDSYLLSDKAYIQAYLPGTTNSQQKIFIPSDLPVDNTQTVLAPASTISDPLTGISKVDLLLTDDGDLAVNNYGDLRLSYGLTNLIQALKIKFSVQKNSWILYPDFGLGIQPGTSNVDVNVAEIYKSIQGIVVQDPRFTSVDKLQVVLSGPEVLINMTIKVAGQKGVFPVNFTLS